MDKVSDPLFEYKLSFFLSRASCPADFNRRYAFVRKKLRPYERVSPAAANHTCIETFQYTHNLKKLFEKVLLLEEAAKRREWHSRSTAPLSRREIAIAVLLLEGRRAKQIAELLQIRLSTAERHIANIYKKMNIHHRHELARRMGIELQDAP